MPVPRVIGLERASVSHEALQSDVTVDPSTHVAATVPSVDANESPAYDQWFREDVGTNVVASTQFSDGEAVNLDPQPRAAFEPLAFIRDNLPQSTKERSITAGALIIAALSAAVLANGSSAEAPTASAPKPVNQSAAPNPLALPSTPFSPEPSPTASKPAELGPVLSSAIFDCSKLAVNMTLSGNAEVGVVANLKNGKKAYVSIPNDIANVAKKNAKTRHPGTSFSGTAGYGVCLPKGTTANTVIVQNGDTLQVDRASFVSLLVLPKNVSADPKAKNREQIDTLIAPISAKAAPTITAASLALINSELAPKGALRKAYVAKVAAEFAAAMGQDVAAKQNKVIASYFDSRLYQILKKANTKFKIVFVNSYAPPSAHQPQADNKKLDNVSLISLDVTAQILKKAAKA